MDAAASRAGLVPSLTEAHRALPRGCSIYALNPSFSFVRFDLTTKRIPASLAVSVFNEGKGYPSWGPSALVKTPGLRSYISTFALPLNKAVSAGFELASDPDAGGCIGIGIADPGTDKVVTAPEIGGPDVCLYFAWREAAWRVERAVKRLKSAQSEAEEAGVILMKKEARMEEAEKQSEAAQSALKGSEIVSFWVLNFLASKGQDIDNDFCTISSKEAWKKLEAAQSNADEASVRVNLAKVSLKRAEENAKAAEDAVKKCKENASREIKSSIEIFNAALDIILKTC